MAQLLSLSFLSGHNIVEDIKTLKPELNSPTSIFALPIGMVLKDLPYVTIVII